MKRYAGNFAQVFDVIVLSSYSRLFSNNTVSYVCVLSRCFSYVLNADINEFGIYRYCCGWLIERLAYLRYFVCYSFQ